MPGLRTESLDPAINLVCCRCCSQPHLLYNPRDTLGENCAYLCLENDDPMQRRRMRSGEHIPELAFSARHGRRILYGKRPSKRKKRIFFFHSENYKITQNLLFFFFLKPLSPPPFFVVGGHPF